MKKSCKWFAAIVAAATVFAATDAKAVLENVGPGQFLPAAPVIEFDEVPVGTPNPVYFFPGVQDLGDVTVSFGESFDGQTATAGFPRTLSDSTPSDPLTLNAIGTATVTDGATDTNPVLSGTPIFNGPIAVHFSTPVNAVGLKAGFFNGVGATTIEAYGPDGAVLGSIVNSVLGFEFYGLRDTSGENVISGISFFITGDEPAGFEIDNLTFGSAELVPEPSSIVLLGCGLLAAGLYSRKLRRRSA